MPDNVRPLTDEEIEAFPGDSSVNVAISNEYGEWYGDEAEGPDGPEAMFVTDEDGDYILVEE
jgi:hypothetical protein